MKIIDIRVKFATGERSVTIDANNKETYIVTVNSPPADGRANEEIIETLSKYFKIPKSLISIIKGKKGRKKTIKLEE